MRTFQPRETRVCASYALVADNEEERDETFTVSLSRLAPSLSPNILRIGTRDSATVTILDQSMWLLSVILFLFFIHRDRS